ncbi:serine carboxypeptidase 1 isoform X1 [Zea mays]|uniref:Serine carboxypeptidase-like 19 n=1 Tax=Zea mays TaxID=4577 RepID=C0HFI7_MAIZE|nr:serine carboxypeptidase 1 isoform X1 [Zea mays]ACN25790.1 unknown [Zea mays]
MTPLSSSGSPAATAAPSSAASPTRSVPSDSSWNPTTAPCRACDTTTTRGQRCHISSSSIHRLELDFPSREIPKATMSETSRPHCSYRNSSSSDHPEYLANPFYIGGDSYVGKIVPFLGQMISEGIELGRRPFPNLKGYLVGNPITGESIDFTSRVPYAHGVGIISDQLYETILGHCQGEDYTSPANALCAQALDTFNNLINEVQNAQILLDTCVYASPAPNVLSRPVDGGRRILRAAGMGGGATLNHPPARPRFGCITYGYYLSYFWANDERTRTALGIKKGTVDEWVRCHDADLPYTIDLKSAIKYHRNLTSRGYRALVYSGDHDLLVPHLGTQAWVRSLNFPVVDDWRAWHLGGQAAGFTINYSNNMTFATIKGGGHTAPEYEPERCFAMFSRWILDRPL